MQAAPVGATLLSILFGVTLTAITCFALGALVLRSLKIGFYREEHWPFAFLAGGSVLSGIVFGLGCLHLIYPVTLLGVSLLSIGLCFFLTMKQVSDARLPPLPNYLKALFIGGFGAYNLLYVRYALAPENSPDGMVYHLGLTNLYLQAHGIFRITTTFYASLSQGLEMLFLFAFAFGKHSAAASVHYLFLICLPLLMLLYARRFGMPSAGVAGALLVFASPVLGIDGTSAYIDVALACVIFAAFYALEIWDHHPENGPLILAGLLCGFAFAIKYTGVSAIAGAVLYVLWRQFRRHETGTIRTCFVLLVSAAPLALVWLIKNWLWVDNPIAPLGNAIFPNPYLHVSFEREYTEVLRNMGGVRFWEAPLELAVRDGHLSGLIGPAFMAAPIAILAFRARHGRRLLAAAAITGVACLFTYGARFVIPMLPFVALAMGIALARVPMLLCAFTLAHLILCWPTVVKRYSAPQAWRLERVPWRAVLRSEKEDDYLHARRVEYRLARMVEASVPPGERVFSFHPIAQSYTSREILVSYQAAFNEKIRSVLCAGYEPDSCQPLLIMRFSFAPAQVRMLRVVQLGKAENAHWSISEIRVASLSAPLMIDAKWRVNASPNPWDAGWAIDGSPVTRWSSWESLHPGMFFQIDMNQLHLVDTVDLDGPEGQWESRLKLEGSVDGQHWTVLSTNTSLQKSTRVANYRRLAGLEVKRLGVSYILVKNSDREFKDFNDHPSEWGITQVGYSADGKVFRID